MFRRLILLCVLAFVPGLTTAQDAAQNAPAFSKEQVEQLVAPIALYPDSLLSQVLMAATYPADVVEAAKWSKANPNQKGDAAVKAVESQAWDPSVKSLVAFPQVLAMMGDKPDWVQNLGDAFLASSKDVLDAAQRLRTKAQQAGNLKSNEQQKVVVESSTQVIQIEPANPEVVYVPTYNPTVVYGPWPYPSYPPYYWPPPPAYYPGYALASGIAFGIGVGITASLWGNCNWGHGDVDIDVNKYNNINSNNKIDRNKNKFEHNGANRKGVPYRDQRSRDKFGKDIPGASQRDNFRGRDAQRQQAQNTLKDRNMDPGMERDRLRNDPQTRERAQDAARNTDRGNFDRGGMDHDRGGSGFDNNRGGGMGGDRAGGGRDNALSGAGNGHQARQQMDRGSSSRQSMSRSGGGGGGRAAGGGGRGGGGRRR